MASTRKQVVAVRCTQPDVLGNVLLRLGPDAFQALSEGRIFIGRMRAVTTDAHVRAGDEVIMYPQPAPSTRAMYVIGECGDMIAVYKPPDLSSISDHRGNFNTLQKHAGEHLGVPARTLHPTSRLDRGVSGVVVFATSPETRGWLAAARRAGTYVRHYVGIAAKPVDPPRGVWRWPIGRASDRRHRVVGGDDARPAETRYAIAATSPSGAVLLALAPVTGRTHQIRVHAAHAGCPLFGDSAYGGPTRIIARDGAVVRVARIALHAAWVEVPAPFGGLWRPEAAIPADLAAIWRELGGNEFAWADALKRC